MVPRPPPPLPPAIPSSLMTPAPHLLPTPQICGQLLVQSFHPFRLHRIHSRSPSILTTIFGLIRSYSAGSILARNERRQNLVVPAMEMWSILTKTSLKKRLQSMDRSPCQTTLNSPWLRCIVMASHSADSLKFTRNPFKALITWASARNKANSPKYKV